MKNAVKTAAPAAKNSVKIANAEETQGKKFSPKNIVRLTVQVCKGSIVKKDGFVAFRAFHSMGFNPSAKSYRTPLYVKVVGSDRLIEGYSDAIEEGTRALITGYLQTNKWQKTQNLKEGEEAHNISELVITATDITIYPEGTRMPSVNEFEISGFVVKDRVTVGSFDKGDIVRCALCHPMGSYKNKAGEEVRRDSVFVNAVSFPKRDEAKQVDNELIADNNLLVIGGSLKPNNRTYEGRNYYSIDFSINTLEQFDYNIKSKEQVETEAAPAAEADAE